jgi:hypothetical protein
MKTRWAVAASALLAGAVLSGCGGAAPEEPSEENVRRREAAEAARKHSTEKEIRREVDRAYEETRGVK